MFVALSPEGRDKAASIHSSDEDSDDASVPSNEEHKVKFDELQCIFRNQFVVLNSSV